ncbi:MAG: 1-acyl-sn-glycerol-3-phosphate acyltransferase [Anaerolineales bacterium]|nr:1-acyl-sn-glycerol-3-phosphate acyltransferase [Anaerolineales bacterium]
MANKFARFLVRLIFKLIARVKVEGKENIPNIPSAVVVSNHVGRLDAGLIYYFVEQQEVIMMVAEKYREHAFFRWLAESLDGIFVDRFNADLNAMREVLRRLKKGGVLAIAPEGTRSPSGALLEGRDGASYIAAKAGVPVLPVGIQGTQDFIVSKRLKHLQRLDILARVGKPFMLPPLVGKDREAHLHTCTEEIMCQIAALLPQEMRGYYVNYPRVQELIQQNGQG